MREAHVSNKKEFCPLKLRMRLGGTPLSPIQRTSIAVRICVANLLELAQGYYSIIPFLFLVLLLFPQEEDER